MQYRAGRDQWTVVRIRDGLGESLGPPQRFWPGESMQISMAGLAAEYLWHGRGCGDLPGSVGRMGVRLGLRAVSQLSTHVLTFSVPQGSEEKMPEALEAPATKMIKDRLPWWKVVGQVTPGTARAHEVKDCI
jgi:hypothetical protein